MIPGDGGAVDEFGLPILSELRAADGPDGGVWIAIVEQRPIADEIEGKPDTRVPRYVLLDREMRSALGALLLGDHSFGPPPG